MLKKQPKKLWTNSPCSLNYEITKLSFQTIPRFQHGSIYDKDEPTKQKKIFNQIQRPDILLLNFRKAIKEAEHQKYYRSFKLRSSSRNNKIVHKESYNKKSQMSTTSSRFYSVPHKTQLKYDRNGFRSSLYGDYEIKKNQKKKRSQKLFSATHRLDLSKPLNFYPGPGTYMRNPQNGSVRSKIKQQRIKTLRIQPRFTQQILQQKISKISSHRCKTSN